MLPETDFHKRANSMFVIYKGRYYTAENSLSFLTNGKTDFLCFNDLFFPLSTGCYLEQEEQQYLKRNRKSLEEELEEIEKRIKNGEGFNDQNQELEILSDISFFLENIARKDNPDTVITDFPAMQKIQIFSSEDIFEGISIFPEIISSDYLVFNGRLYPLKEIARPSFVRIENRDYTIQSSKKTVSEIEKEFKQGILRELQKRLIQRSDRFKEISEEKLRLLEKNEFLTRKIGVSIYTYAYESGNIGFDKHARCVYSLIRPHFNHTTGRSYSEGQSAATLILKGGKLESSGRFAERESRNSPFSISTSNHCLGTLHLLGQSIEEKMLYLREFANTVETRGGFYQIPDTSSSNDDSGY